MFLGRTVDAIDPQSRTGCMRGLHPKDIGRKLLTKYRHALTYVLTDASEWVNQLELEEWLRESQELEPIGEHA